MELRIEIQYEIGDKFWSIKDNKISENKVTRIKAEIEKKKVQVWYISGICHFRIENMFKTKDLLVDSL